MTGKEDLKKITRSACDNGFNLIIAAGGDGTVAGVVNGLVGTQVPMAIIPLGTGNGVARAMKIPLNLKDAVEVLSGENTNSRN